jgi:enoyl-CoA hydratase/carnithine racemase
VAVRSTTPRLVRVVDDDEVSGLRWLLLDRPDRVNALNEAMVDQIDEALDQAQATGVRVLAVDTDLSHLSSGLDLAVDEVPAEHRDAVLSHRLTRIATVLERLRTSRFATAVIVKGGAFGAGADLSLACHRRVSVTGAGWSFPGVRFGIALGTAQLARVVGVDRARLILLSQERIDERAALEWGIVQTVLPDHDAARAEIRRFAAQVERLAPAAVSAVLEATMALEQDRAVGALARSASAGSVAARLESFRAESRRR